MTPQDIGQLAAAGIAQLKVRSQLRIAILSTGDEVASAFQTAAGNAQILDANGPMLQGLLAADGFEAASAQIIPDNREALSNAFSKALDDADVLITSGGASDGLEDHASSYD